MNARPRPGFTVFDLLVVLAILGVLLGLLLPAIQKVREAAARTQSMNHLKQIALACHNYHDVHTRFPSGNDRNNFSAYAHLLPYMEQEALFRNLNFNNASDAEGNAQVRDTRVAILLSPLDPAAREVKAGTNYLFNAGSLYSLEKNNGVFYKDSQVRLAHIRDGTSNTLMTGETLLGQELGTRNVQRQHVVLDKEALKNLKEESGVQDFQDGKNLASDRGRRWLDGRFLQTTFTGTRLANDSRPDVNCAGLGGLSGLRSHGKRIIVGFCDGSVHSLSTDINLQTWHHLTQRNDGQVIPIPILD